MITSHLRSHVEAEFVFREILIVLGERLGDSGISKMVDVVDFGDSAGRTSEWD